MAASRGLGDTWALPYGLSSAPDAASLALPPPPAAGRHLLIVASDGLWAVVGSAEAVGIAAGCATAAEAAEALAQAARYRSAACTCGQRFDDTTIAVAFLG